MKLNRRIYRALRGDKGGTLAAGVLLLFLFALSPLAPLHTLLRVAAIGAFSAFLALAAVRVFEPRPLPLVLVALIVATALLHAVAQYASPAVDAVASAFTLATAAALAPSYMARAFRDGRVDRHRIMGAVVAFLLVGIAFAQAYRLIVYAAPSAFVLAGAPAATAELLPRLADFSFATLSSVGFGDVTPMHPVARRLATLEALAGALFVAVLIARLVAKELEWRRERREIAERARVALSEDPAFIRSRIAERYLRGVGIEIGALDMPTRLPAGAIVRYVDFRMPAELAQQYPDVDPRRFVPIDIVDDGERLDRLPDASVDFIIANHMLEHCENPLGTVRQHLRKLKTAGWLFYAMPDPRVNFDARRPMTPFEHLVADDRDGGASSRFEHYLEWSRLVNGIDDESQALAQARTNAEQRYSIHFHVWDSNAWFDFLVRAREYLDRAFDIRVCEFTGTEIVCVLRKA